MKQPSHLFFTFTGTPHLQERDALPTKVENHSSGHIVGETAIVLPVEQVRT